MPGVNEINFMVNVTYGDSSLSDSSSSETKLLTFIIWGIILPLVVTAGLIGNILTIIVLWRREMHSTTILYLRGLVITDTGILIGSVVTLTPISCANYLQGETSDYIRDVVYPIIHSPGYYIMMTLQQCNVWITVSVSMERYIAICHPFRAARLINRRKTIIVLISVVVISLIYNIPHLLATKTSPCHPRSPPLYSQDSNLTVPKNKTFFQGWNSSTTSQRTFLTTLTPTATTPTHRCLVLEDSEFGTSQFYFLYRSTMYTIIIYIIPFLALLVLNIFLIKELMIMQRRRTGTNIHDENEANLSLVLVLIVIVFIFCQTPGLVSQFDIIHVDVFFYWLAFSNFLFTTNSAVNFLIYTAFGRKFRRVLLRVFRHIFKRKERHFQSSFRMTQYSDANFDTCEPTEAHCSSFRGVACYKKETHPRTESNENLPLNTVPHPSSVTFNGVIGSSNCNNGTGLVHSSSTEDDVNVESKAENGEPLETSALNATGS